MAQLDDERSGQPRPLSARRALASPRGLLGFPAPKRLAEPLVEARQQLPQRPAGRPRVVGRERAEQIEHQPAPLQADSVDLGAEARVPAQRYPRESVRLAIADEQAERQRVGERE